MIFVRYNHLASQTQLYDKFSSSASMSNIVVVRHLCIPILALVVVGCLFTTATAVNASASPEIRTIGLLVPYTGNVPTALSGQVDEAVDFALDEFNRYLHESGMDWRLEVVKRDTKSDPAETLAAVEELDSMGIKALLGPATSSNLREIQDYVAANGMVTISYASGASDLSIPGDRIFRTIADATTYANAKHELLRNDGIKEVVVVFLDDVIGRSINHTIYEAVEADTNDGMSIRNTIKFHPDIGDTSVVATQLGAVLAADPPVDDYAQLGIVVFDYTGKIVDIIRHVAGASIPGMNDTRWYGPDHSMNELYADDATRSFLIETDYRTISLAYRENDLNIRIDSLINDAGTYAYAAYDALFIMGNAISMAENATDGDAIADAIPKAARLGHGPGFHQHIQDPLIRGSGNLLEYAGALGASVELNEAGDLARSDYTISSIGDDGFRITHRYDSTMDSVHEFDLPDMVKIGILVSETGSLAEEIGIAASDAISLATYNFNLELAREGADWRLDIYKKDDQTYPPATLKNVEAFHADDIRALIGPLTSDSTASMMDFVNDNNMVAVGYASSSPALALPDNIFRMRASDDRTADVYAKLLRHDGITDLIIVYRDDPWGRSLNEHITERASHIDAITVHSGISYNPANSTMDHRVVVDTLKSRLADLDMSGVAVMLFGFSESWDIIDIASTDPALQEGRWYAFLTSPNVQPSPDQIPWMEKVGCSSVITRPVSNTISRHIDVNVPGANFYSYHAYDALYTLANAIKHVGTNQNAEALAAAIPKEAELLRAAIGFQTTLNEAGDLVGSDYNVYEIRDGVFQVKALYDHATDSLYLLVSEPLPHD